VEGEQHIAPWKLSDVRRGELGNDDLHHLFQAGLIGWLAVGLLPYVLVMGKVL
jgi:hypothetical protein